MTNLYKNYNLLVHCDAQEWRRSPGGAKTRTAEEGVFELRTLYHPQKGPTA